MPRKNIGTCDAGDLHVKGTLTHKKLVLKVADGDDLVLNDTHSGALIYLLGDEHAITFAESARQPGFNVKIVFEADASATSTITAPSGGVAAIWSGALHWLEGAGDAVAVVAASADVLTFAATTKAGSWVEIVFIDDKDVSIHGVVVAVDTPAFA